MPDSTPTTGKTERNSLVVMACTMASRLLGIVRARVVGSCFGGGGVGDVINFTYNIPNNFRKLFAEGAMSSSYIPTFSNEIAEGRRDRAEALMGELFTWQLVLFVVLDLLSIRFGGDVIRWFSDFSTAQVALGARLLPFFMVFLTSISLGTIFSGMLQCQGRFFASSFAPLLFSVTVIGGVLATHDRLGPMSMAYSVMLGGFLELGCWYAALRRTGFRLRLSLRPSGNLFPLVLKRWLQVLSASLVQVLGQQVAYAFASGLGEGSVTAFSNATIFWQTPYGICFTAIGTVYFPLMSASYAANDRGLLCRQVSLGVQKLAMLLVPATLLLCALSDACVSAVLQSGAFSLASCMQTARVVRVFAWGMLAVAWYAFLQRFCYSIGRYRLALRLSIAQTILDIAASAAGIRAGLDVVALPLANTVSFLLVLLAMLWGVRDVWHVGRDADNARMLARILLANLPLLAACLGYGRLGLTFWQEGSTLRVFAITCAFGLAGIALVLASYRLFRIPLLEVLHHARGDERMTS